MLQELQVRFFLDCTEKQASEISRHVTFTIQIKHKLENQKEVTELALAADMTQMHMGKKTVWKTIK
jgi:hypothetical protein